MKTMNNKKQALYLRICVRNRCVTVYAAFFLHWTVITCSKMVARPARISCQLVVIKHLLLLVVMRMLLVHVMVVVVVVVLVFRWISQAEAERPARTADNPPSKAKCCSIKHSQQQYTTSDSSRFPGHKFSCSAGNTVLQMRQDRQMTQTR